MRRAGMRALFAMEGFGLRCKKWRSRGAPGAELIRDRRPPTCVAFLGGASRVWGDAERTHTERRGPPCGAE